MSSDSDPLAIGGGSPGHGVRRTTRMGSDRAPSVPSSRAVHLPGWRQPVQWQCHPLPEAVESTQDEVTNVPSGQGGAR